jgi:DNA-binding MarR family transcriptional regulator
VDIYSRKLVANHDLTAPQVICLLAVVENGPVTATGLARQVYLSPSTIVGILDRLEKKGLVHRLRDSNDRRVVNISATEKGIELAYNAPSPLQDSLANSLKELSELEQSTIALSLKRIVGLMEAGHLEAAPILETDQPNQSGRQ